MSKNLTTSILKKAIITISLLSVLAVGTIISGYATTYNLGSVSNFTVPTNGSKTFSSYNDVKGTVSSQTTSYCNIFNSASQSEGITYVQNSANAKKYGEGSYYVQKNYPAPYVRNYSNVPAGNNTHYWKNTSGAGFSTSTLQIYLYT